MEKIEKINTVSVFLDYGQATGKQLEIEKIYMIESLEKLFYI